MRFCLRQNLKINKNTDTRMMALENRMDFLKLFVCLAGKGDYERTGNESLCGADE